MRGAQPVRLMAWLFAGFAAVGGIGFGLGVGGRAAVSFLAGMAVATVTVSLGVVMVDVAGRIAPVMAMVAALTNYLMTVLLFVVLLKTVSPSVAHIPAFATGLAVSVVPYLAWQFARARPGR